MCGIAGVSLKKENFTFQKKFSKVFNYLKHRGPDGKGAYKKKMWNFYTLDCLSLIWMEVLNQLSMMEWF